MGAQKCEANSRSQEWEVKEEVIKSIVMPGTGSEDNGTYENEAHIAVNRQT